VNEKNQTLKKGRLWNVVKASEVMRGIVTSLWICS